MTVTAANEEGWEWGLIYHEVHSKDPQFGATFVEDEEDVACSESEISAYVDNHTFTGLTCGQAIPLPSVSVKLIQPQPGLSISESMLSIKEGDCAQVEVSLKSLPGFCLFPLSLSHREVPLQWLELLGETGGHLSMFDPLGTFWVQAALDWDAAVAQYAVESFESELLDLMDFFQYS